MAYMPEVPSYPSVMFPKLLSSVLSHGSHWNVPVGCDYYISFSIFFPLLSFPTLPPPLFFPNCNSEKIRGFCHHVNTFMVDFEGRLIGQADLHLLQYTSGNYKSLSVGSGFISNLLLPLLPTGYHYIV